MASRKKKFRLFSIRTLIKVVLGLGLFGGGGYGVMNSGMLPTGQVATAGGDAVSSKEIHSVHGNRLIGEFADRGDDTAAITALMTEPAGTALDGNVAKIGFKKPEPASNFSPKPGTQLPADKKPTPQPAVSSLAAGGPGTFKKPATQAPSTPKNNSPKNNAPKNNFQPRSKPATTQPAVAKLSDTKPANKPATVLAKQTSLEDLLAKNRKPDVKPAPKPEVKPAPKQTKPSMPAAIAQSNPAPKTTAPAQPKSTAFQPRPTGSGFAAAPTNKPAPVIAQTRPAAKKPLFENADAVTNRPQPRPGAQQSLLAEADAARKKIAAVTPAPKVIPKKIDPNTNSQFSSVGSLASGLKAPPRTNVNDRPAAPQQSARRPTPRQPTPRQPTPRQPASQQPAAVPSRESLAANRALGNQTARSQTAPPRTQNLSTTPRPLTSQPSTQASRPSTPRPINVTSVSTASNSVSTNPGKPENRPGDRGLEGIQTPTLSLEKSAPREIQVGRPATFKLIVRNNGRVPAYGVTVVDAVPDGTQLTSTRPDPTSRSGADLTWNLGTLQPGESSEIAMELTPQQRGEIGSVARVSFQSQASVRAICTKPQLEIQHTAPNKVLIGDMCVLQINVRNTGDGAATGVIIEENVPENMVHADSQGRKLQYPVGTLAPGESRDLTLRLKAQNPGQIRNTISTSGDGKLFASDELDIEVVAPKIQLDARGPSRRFLERQAIYDLAIANLGTASATNVQMVAKLPRGMKFVETDKNGQYDQRTHAVYWSLIELPPESKGEVKLTLLPIDTGQQIIDYQARADLSVVQNRELPVTVDQYSELFFDVDDVADPIEIGSDTVYHVRVVNQGSRPATNVRLQVKTPDSLQPISAAGATQHQIAGNTIVFAPIERLAPNAEAKFEVQVKGREEGDHRISVELSSDERTEVVAKEESTKVYSDYR